MNHPPIAAFPFGAVPAILYGADSPHVWLYLHGKLGRKEEAESFAQLVCPSGSQVLSIDLPEHGERCSDKSFAPWDAVPELENLLTLAQSRWDHISLRATSLGAWFSLLAFAGRPLEQALLVSPVLDMERLIRGMMAGACVSEEELRAAYDLLAEAKKAGVYQAWVMDEVFDKMEAGEAAVATYYAGDYLSMLENNEDLVYVVPEEGSNWFVDAMCILKNAENVDEAHEWINFMASTDASLKNMDYIWYASPNQEALDSYPDYYEETYGEPLDMERYEIMAAPQEVLDRCEAYLVRPVDTRTLYNDLWTDLGILS